MIKQVTIRERGPAPRGYARAFGNAQKAAWQPVGVLFHEQMRPQRFTTSHAMRAGYTKRKGEGLPRESKGFRASYTGRKLARFGHTRPLEFTGETRNNARMANITTTRKAAKVSYSGTAKLNFRHPKSQIRMNEEFRFVIPSEVTTLAKKFDQELDSTLAKDRTLTTKVVG